MKNDLLHQFNGLSKAIYCAFLLQFVLVGWLPAETGPGQILTGLEEKTISGTVTSREGDPLVGVNILVKGTSIGTASDFDGTYSVTMPDDATTLVFTYTGFNTIEVQIEGRTTVDVTLEENVTQLGEVVITALGIEKSTKSLGFSTVKVDPEEVTVNRSTNFMQSLQGKVSGVNISGMATGAGGSSRISIRGQSAFAGDNQPLIVVDGVPISNDRRYGGT